MGEYGEVDEHVADEHVPGEQALLIDALGVAPSAVRLVTREPLGAGTVSGYDVFEAGTVSSYETVKAGDEGDATHRYYVDTSRLRVAQETGLAMGGDAASPDARVWLHPADPHLPALAPIAFHDAAAALLARFGVTDAGAPEFAGYRPGRRAVLSIDAADHRVWVKVVRQSRVERIAETHRACERAGLPVPAMLGWSPEGVILLDNAEGTPAAEVAWEPETLLNQVDELRGDFARVETSRQARGVAGRLGWYTEQLRSRLSETSGGEVAAELEDVAQQVGTVLARSDADREPRVVHGDLHFGQLFLKDGRISGVIDVDTVGVGDAAEDPAAFLAHATMSALMTTTEARGRVWALADAGMERWGQDQRARGLFAVHMLGHAVAASDGGDDQRVSTLLDTAHRVLAGGLPSQQVAS